MKEKDYIEKLISENLEALNDSEPLEGHFARFEQKLKNQHKTRWMNRSLIWKVAAVLVIGLLVTNQAYIYFSPGGQGLIHRSAETKDISLASLSPEYREIEYYYTSSIRSGLDQWEALKEQGYISEEEQAMMTEELNDFEVRFKNLQKDLDANPNDERVINAMLEYYQSKLSVINLIVDKLEEVKQHKNSSYENL